MKKQKPSIKDSTMTIGGLLLLVIGYIFGVALPGKKEADQIRGEIQATRAAMEQLPARIAEASQLQRQILEQQDYLASTETDIPFRPDLDEVLRQVSSIAQHSQLTITRMEPLPEESRKSYQAIPFRLTFQGHFSSVLRFLSKVEQLDRLFVLKECSLSSGKESGTLHVEGTAGFTVYSRFDSGKK